VGAAETEIAALPEDLATAQQLIAEARKQIAHLQHENKWLRHRLDVLSRRLFGKKTEQLTPGQLVLAYEQLENETGKADEPVETDSGEGPLAGKTKSRRGRRAIPKNLRRVEVVVDLSETEKTCATCGTERERVGEEVSEKYDYIPAELVCRVTRRLKYGGCSCAPGLVTAPAPAQAVEKGLAAEGLLAHVVTSKYVDHQPLYRLEKIFGRHGADISRKTLCDWVAECADALAPIYEHLGRTIVGADYLQTDDTPITILQADGTSRTGRLWVYVDPVGRRVYFDATATREREGPERVLKDFKGYLQADAYSAYDALYRSGRMLEVGCWAHVRRKFFDTREEDPEALKVLALIQKLYAIEREGVAMKGEERRLLRQEKSVRVLEEIDRLRAELARTALPKSGLGEALRYLHNQREALGRYLLDGRLKPDNNGAENQLRVVAVGRKNWLFAGSHAGARRAAVLYTLAQGCKLAGAEPFRYFKDVLLRVATHPASRVAELTPTDWVKTFASTAV
jgi:transposase